MTLSFNPTLSKRHFLILDLSLIFIVSCLPLFLKFPFRFNLFLAWEGAYRLSIGQIPYKDFGLPMGFVYWIIPALFFKIFGPYIITLIKAQVFINLISFFAFRAILKQFHVKDPIVFLSLFIFSISYTLGNFWPWYNHTVFVYELVGLLFVIKYIFNEVEKKNLIFLFLGALFIVLSIFTKQDGGGLGFFISLGLLAYHCIIEKKYFHFFIYLAFVVFSASLFIVPFLKYGFLYWFNYGQAPHFSRVTPMDLLNEIFGASNWLKFYLFLIVVLILTKANDWKSFIHDKREVVFALLTLGILAQAFIVQVTSYTPVNGNIYFHSFAFAYILSNVRLTIPLEKLSALAICILFVGFWWSGEYWNRHIKFIAKKIIGNNASVNPDNVISKNTYMLSKMPAPVKQNRADWRLSDLESFKDIYLPDETIKGIKTIMSLPQIKDNVNPKVLNMSELTPLAYELKYKLGVNQPLWYHKNVGIFQKEIDVFCNKIENKEYDLVLFQTIPELNNFYPDEVRESLIKNYKRVDKFLAPRVDETSFVEVYVRGN